MPCWARSNAQIAVGHVALSRRVFCSSSGRTPWHAQHTSRPRRPLIDNALVELLHKKSATHKRVAVLRAKQKVRRRLAHTHVPFPGELRRAPCGLRERKPDLLASAMRQRAACAAWRAVWLQACLLCVCERLTHTQNNPPSHAHTPSRLTHMQPLACFDRFLLVPAALVKMVAVLRAAPQPAMRLSASRRVCTTRGVCRAVAGGALTPHRCQARFAERRARGAGAC